MRVGVDEGRCGWHRSYQPLSRPGAMTTAPVSHTQLFKVIAGRFLGPV